MTTNLNASQARCSRCQGKMMLDQESGDRTCFTCGHVLYAVEPLERQQRTRTVSHAGQSLN